MARRKSRRAKANGKPVDQREPNGQPQRNSASLTKAEMMSVGVEARQRVHGLTKAQAASKDGGDELGRLGFLGSEGGLSWHQVDALRLYAEINRDMERAVLVRQMRSGSDMDLRGGYDSSDGTEPTYVAKYERAIGRYQRARNVILMTPDCFAQMATDALVLDDKLLWDHIGAIRLAANAMAHEFQSELQAPPKDDKAA